MPGRPRNSRAAPPTGAPTCTRRAAPCSATKESIQLIESLGAKFTPELKGPNRAAKLQVEAVFGNQANYAQAMIDDYKAAGIPAKNVFAQSFNLDDILYWIDHEAKFGKQAVFLDDANTRDELPSRADLKALAARGAKIVAPP